MLGLRSGVRLKPSPGWFARPGRSARPSLDVANINDELPPNFVITRDYLLAGFCRSSLGPALVKSNANAWSARMQTGQWMCKLVVNSLQFRTQGLSTTFPQPLENNSMKVSLIECLTEFCYLTALGISLLFTLSSSAFAFSPKLHSAYTLKAAQTYQNCTGVKLPNQLTEALAKGTDAEDSSMLTLHQRTTNWHFYNRNHALEPFWFANRNLDVIFAKRVEALNTLLANPDADTVKVYEQAGRVLHYIQDMSVPGHVVPAYHAKLPGNHPDPFDEFESIEGLPVFGLSEGQCQDLRGEADKADASPRRFLNDAATATLQVIEQIDVAGKPIVDGAWKGYWVYPSPDPDDARKGWGEYGTCEFTKGVVKADCKSEEELMALFEQQSLQTLKNSVLMLFYLQKRLTELQEKRQRGSVLTTVSPSPR
jgi:hypothetical protein